MKDPINIVRGDRVWPAVDGAADRIIQATRLLRTYLEQVSGPRKRLGKARLLGSINVAILLAEEATARLGEVWGELGQPDHQDAPAVNIEEYVKKDMESKKKLAELIELLDKEE